MLYTYKSILKRLLKNYYSGSDHDCLDKEILTLLSKNNHAFKAITILAAKNLITYKTDIFGEIYEIEITNNGFTYFDDMRDKHFRFWLPVTISLISLISSFRYEILSIFKNLCK